METVIRVTVIYAFIIVGLRIMGKREFGQLSPLELVTLLIIPEILTEALVSDDHSVTNALIGTTTLLSLVYFISLWQHHSHRVHEMIGGKPTVLAHRGRLLEDQLNQEHVTPGEIFGEMHKRGLERLEQVKWAILETDGKISIIPEDAQATAPTRPAHRPEDFTG
jgi:uncharacterized membrane protein YcaP (DUF421 family)